jgi:hypothetical protein
MGTVRTDKELQYGTQAEAYFSAAVGSLGEKLDNFPKFASRQNLSIFLFKWEIFKQILEVQGSIVECGVRAGGGLFTFAQFSSILEPVNYQRKVIGLDTFEGFPEIEKQDLVTKDHSPHAHVGGFGTPGMLEDLQQAIRLFDMNRSIGHVPKIELVAGDVHETLPKYLQENPHTLVSLLYLDFDLYQPTKTALQLLRPRMPKGSIIAFDEVNHRDWPGETTALLESLDLNQLRLRRMPFEPLRCYAILE